MTDIYDYVIIGGGPCGLVLSYTLSYMKYRVVLIEKENSIGGCHRVNRKDGLFTEHGPRVYTDAYVNMISILRHMGLDFYDLFTKYDPDKWSFFKLKPGELLVCFIEYIKLFFDGDYGRDKSVQLLIQNFSPESRDFIDRLCRMTDGAGSDRYTVHQFLNLFNQNIIHNVYIPKEPNDTGLFSKWKLGDTKVMLGKSIKNIDVTERNIQSITLNDDTIVGGKNFLFCVPPLSLVSAIKGTSLENAFGDYDKLVSWAIRTGYNSYIPIVYHWDSEIPIPRKWGFPALDWGIAFIVMSRYMKFSDGRSRTVISTCIMYSDKPSSITGKTANQSSREELISEVFRQLKVALGTELPSYTFATPNAIYQEDGIWYDTDKSYVVTPGCEFLESKSPLIDNLYSVGTHNGNSVYSFTTFESAITNGLHLLHKLCPKAKKEFRIKSPLSLDIVIKCSILIIIFFYCIYIVLIMV